MLTRSEKAKVIRTNLARVRDLLSRAESQATKGRTPQAIYDIETALEYVNGAKNGLLDLAVMIREGYSDAAGGKRRHVKAEAAKPSQLGALADHVNRLVRS